MQGRIERAGDPRRALPSVDRLIEHVASACPGLPAWAVARAARETLSLARQAAQGGPDEPRPVELAALTRAAAARAGELAAARPRRVVNATGIVLHTNLGRAPLAPGAAAAAAAAGSLYTDLELELSEGRRGDRLAPVCEKLAALAGAEAALAVNNNAAALLLALDTLARGREVVVSRGELVEIGGSFRIPEIVERAGVVLREVGTTNRTHPEDYRRAIGPATALLLKVHRSNFEQRGFVAEVGLAQLAEIGRERGIPVVEDLGSATLVELPELRLPEEAHAPSRLRLGADVVCFSGDKLLGGPQAGILLGGAASISAMRGNPLARALRLDKMTLAALDWTLRALLDGRRDEIPALRLLCSPLEALEARARRLADRLAEAAAGELRIGVEPGRAPLGAGSLPGIELDTWVVTLRGGSGAQGLASALRRAEVPVLGRIREEALLLDVRTLLEGDEPDCVEALRGALGTPSR